MSNPFIGEIRIFAGNFAPDGWFFCNGQMLGVQQYLALYAVISNTYGGNGTTTFALPNLQAYAPMGAGAGPTLTPRPIGQPAGTASVALDETQMPSHTHAAQSTNQAATSPDPTDRLWAKNTGLNLYSTSNNNPVQMAAGELGATGGAASHNNMQPYLGINFIIAWQGYFPVNPN
ncbi:MAG TPA: tail fiber protein [Geobacteraceae bacterium]